MKSVSITIEVDDKLENGIIRKGYVAWITKTESSKNIEEDVKFAFDFFNNLNRGAKFTLLKSYKKENVDG